MQLAATLVLGVPPEPVISERSLGVCALKQRPVTILRSSCPTVRLGVVRGTLKKKVEGKMSRRGARMSLCSVVSLVLMVVVVPSQASGSSSGSAPEDGAVRFLASEAGVDPAEAARRLALQERFNDAGAAAVDTAGQIHLTPGSIRPRRAKRST